MSGAPNPQTRRLAFIGVDGRVVGDSNASITAPSADDRVPISSGGVWTSGPEYVTSSFATTWTGPLATPANSTLQLTRVGGIVTCCIPAVSGAGDGVTTALASTTAVPLNFRPSAGQSGIVLLDPGTGTSIPVTWFILNSGQLNFCGDTDLGPIPATAGVISWETICITWSV